MRGRFESAAVRRGDGTTDRQAHAHAAGFRGEEWLKELAARFGRQPTAGIADADLGLALAGSARTYAEDALLGGRVLHRFQRIAHEVQHDLFDLDAVRQDRRQVRS